MNPVKAMVAGLVLLVAGFLGAWQGDVVPVEYLDMVGMKPGNLDRKIGKLVPGYMTMGQDGMAGMAQMGMPVPDNSIPMKGSKGPFGYIGMGGMFTLVKVRNELSSYDDPGWYKHPPGTVASEAPSADLIRDGIKT